MHNPSPLCVDCNCVAMRRFHGAVWHYDFVMGANRKSYGLDINILICCIIVFGDNDSTNEAGKKAPPAAATSVVIDDLGAAAPKKAKKAKEPAMSPYQQVC